MTSTYPAAATPDSPPATLAPDNRSPALMLTVLLTGTFMASLDVSIVNVAVPRIGDELDASEAALQFVVSGYTVAYAALLITGARLGDDRGHRRMFTTGLAVFTATSLVCGVVPGVELLVVARVLQGAAAAMMAPQVLTIVQRRLPSERQPMAFALYASVISGAVVAGQVLGGVLVDADLFGWSWRTVFLVNVPIGVAVLSVVPRCVPETDELTRRRLDITGVGLLAATVAAIIVPLVVGRETGFSWGLWVLLAAAVPLGALFARHVSVRQAVTGDALIDLALLRRPAVALGFGSVVAQMAAYGGMLFAITLHLQRGLGFSPIRSGLSLVTFAVAFAISSLAVPRLSAAARRAAPVAGLVVTAAGFLVAAWLAREGHWNMATTGLAFAVVGGGFGCGYSPVVSRTVATVPRARAADASGMFTTLNQLAFAIGVAAVGSVYLAARSGPTAGDSGSAMAVTFVVAAALMLVAAGAAATQRAD
ncbi:MFS transporter [Desertimonas flava]|uniref:MFS transporter n=1 Tax=Desertimonas flava TaxID=2064846 RepID=UPI0013C43EA8|nr:MFS transporter [Desertimonas flava]